MQQTRKTTEPSSRQEGRLTVWLFCISCECFSCVCLRFWFCETFLWQFALNGLSTIISTPLSERNLCVCLSLSLSLYVLVPFQNGIFFFDGCRLVGQSLLIECDLSLGSCFITNKSILWFFRQQQQKQKGKINCKIYEGFVTRSICDNAV